MPWTRSRAPTATPAIEAAASELTPADPIDPLDRPGERDPGGRAPPRRSRRRARATRWHRSNRIRGSRGACATLRTARAIALIPEPHERRRRASRSPRAFARPTAISTKAIAIPARTGRLLRGPASPGRPASRWRSRRAGSRCSRPPPGRRKLGSRNFCTPAKTNVTPRKARRIRIDHGISVQPSDEARRPVASPPSRIGTPTGRVRSERCLRASGAPFSHVRDIRRSRVTERSEDGKRVGKDRIVQFAGLRRLTP